MVMNVQDRGVLPEEMRYTYSVCPVCLKRIPAKREERDGQIYLVKTCPEHGTFSSVIWRNKRKFADWRGERPAVGENLNCPAGCGLCAEHRRATCCTLLEITARCNMNCTFCFAEPDGAQDPSLDTVKRWINDLTEPGKTLLQLSGGEPTVRDDLPEIVAYAKQVGCKYVQLNSNGLRLAEDEAFVKRLADAGLSFVFMQFDGVDDAVYEKLRRRPMLEVKKRAIEQCGRYGIGVTLVPVIVPGTSSGLPFSGRRMCAACISSRSAILDVSRSFRRMMTAIRWMSFWRRLSARAAGLSKRNRSRHPAAITRCVGSTGISS